MIILGQSTPEKNSAIARYCDEHEIARVVSLSPAKFQFPCSAPNHEWVEWAEIIMYRTYYRLLREIDNRTLVVVNECLRTQNRHDLTYNCIRLFLNQTPHRLIFQCLPVIDAIDDFMILFDFDTRSRWKREPFRPELLAETTIGGRLASPSFQATPVETDAGTRATYAREKRKLIDGIGLRDPHTIPRNLYQISGRARLAATSADRWYLGRNNRFKMANLQTFREATYPHRYDVFEFCHNAIDFADVVALSGQTAFTAIVSDLKVDQWYFQRYTAWAQRVGDAGAILRLQENGA